MNRNSVRPSKSATAITSLGFVHAPSMHSSGSHFDGDTDAHRIEASLEQCVRIILLRRVTKDCPNLREGVQRGKREENKENPTSLLRNGQTEYHVTVLVSQAEPNHASCLASVIHASLTKKIQEYEVNVIFICPTSQHLCHTFRGSSIGRIPKTKVKGNFYG
ncbi:hypothetical protein CVT25_002062 [Psilocybe cyanescens]|uniref:Uncharacterized protein n=1 Tax=Psilocybe cyanescens TaxID=93625 RepID=A0A409X969_PSICY|nr:hypothetical protein CVT25_002062 [Psilocybe cyanescens]